MKRSSNDYDDARIEYEREHALPSDLEFEPVTSEDEDYESSPPEYQISTFPADFTLEVLHNKWLAKEIEIPKFQRGFVWKQVQASKLIESFLVGLPVPAVFLYTERKSQTHLVIDGQQRLKSIFYFLEGYFQIPESSKHPVFKLTGLSEKSKFYEKTFEDLAPEDKRRFKNCVLRAFIIQQQDPQDDTSMYHVFERLNTGGTLLTNQEVRNCVYQGDFCKLLDIINKDENWRKLLGSVRPDSRKKDLELIVRFFALRDTGAYEKPMKDFLSRYMRKNQNPGSSILEKEKSLFAETAKVLVEKLGSKPFHIRAGLNTAVFDAVMVATAANLTKIPSNLKKRYKKLLEDKDFDNATRQHTTDKEILLLRLKKARQILFS